MNQDDNNMLRLIANPYRLNKKEEIFKKSSTDDFLFKYLKITYKEDHLYINQTILQEIKEIIDDKINDFKIKKFSKELVSQCIQNVLQKFENNI